MIYDAQADAYEFRAIHQQSIDCFAPNVLDLQLSLIKEEVAELEEAYEHAKTHIQNEYPRAELLKELADVVYVAFQFAAAAGYDLNEALDRVHKSNLSKLVDGKPLKREDGKVLKGPNYKPPHLIDLIRKY